METTTFRIDDLADEAARAVRDLLDDEFGVARVLVRPERREVYVKHSAAKAPRGQLLARLAEEGYSARIKNP